MSESKTNRRRRRARGANYSEEETRRIFLYLSENGLLKYMLGMQVAKIMSQLRIVGCRSHDSINNHIKLMLKPNSRLRDRLDPEVFNAVKQTYREKKRHKKLCTMSPTLFNRLLRQGRRPSNRRAQEIVSLERENSTGMMSLPLNNPTSPVNIELQEDRVQDRSPTPAHGRSVNQPNILNFFNIDNQHQMERDVDDRNKSSRQRQSLPLENTQQLIGINNVPIVGPPLVNYSFSSSSEINSSANVVPCAESGSSRHPVEMTNFPLPPNNANDHGFEQPKEFGAMIDGYVLSDAATLRVPENVQIIWQLSDMHPYEDDVVTPAAAEYDRSSSPQSSRGSTLSVASRLSVGLERIQLEMVRPERVRRRAIVVAENENSSPASDISDEDLNLPGLFNERDEESDSEHSSDSNREGLPYTAAETRAIFGFLRDHGILIYMRGINSARLLRYYRVVSRSAQSIQSYIKNFLKKKADYMKNMLGQELFRAFLAAKTVTGRREKTRVLTDAILWEKFNLTTDDIRTIS